MRLFAIVSCCLLGGAFACGGENDTASPNFAAGSGAGAAAGSISGASSANGGLTTSAAGQSNRASGGGSVSGGHGGSSNTSLGGAGSTLAGGVTNGGAADRASGGSTMGGNSAGGVGGRPLAGGSSNGGGSQGGSRAGGSAGRPEGGSAGVGSNVGGNAGSGNGCPSVGHVTYTLAKANAPTSEQVAAYDRITRAMDEAVRYYNCHTDITKTLNVSYVPSVATADGNINGSIRFGSTASMNRVTAMHEISHTLGVGTSSKWSSLVVNGKFTGSNALAQLLAIPNRLGDTIGADSQHFWPYGLNYESEGRNESDLIGHCLMVVAIRKDLGM